MRVIHVLSLGKHGSFNVVRAFLDSQKPRLLSAVPLRSIPKKDISLLFSGAQDVFDFMREVRRVKPWEGRFEVRQFSISEQGVITEPLIILGAPRCGSTLLFEVLSHCLDLWTIGGESHEIFESLGSVPGDRGNRLDETDFDPVVGRVVEGAFLSVIRNRNGAQYLERDETARPKTLRLLEKTPKNSLRIPFLNQVFSNCKFVFLYREPWSNIGSLIDGWLAPERFNSYQLGGLQWKFLLPPDWPRLLTKTVPEISAVQWQAANRFIIDDLSKLEPDRWRLVEYQNLVADPAGEVQRICSFAGLHMDPAFKAILSRPLCLSRSTLTPPETNKWRRHERSLVTIVPSVEDIVIEMKRIRELSGSPEIRNRLMGG